MNLLTLSNTILTLLPVITNTVQAVEAASNTPGNGSAKLQLALGIIKPIYEATNPPVPFDQIVANITSIIAALVTFYNNIGTFVKSVKAV